LEICKFDHEEILPTETLKPTQLNHPTRNPSPKDSYINHSILS